MIEVERARTGAYITAHPQNDQGFALCHSWINKRLDKRPERSGLHPKKMQFARSMSDYGDSVYSMTVQYEYKTACGE